MNNKARNVRRNKIIGFLSFNTIRIQASTMLRKVDNDLDLRNGSEGSDSDDKGKDQIFSLSFIVILFLSCSLLFL